MSKDKVLSIVPAKPPTNESVVSIIYTDGNSELIEADAFAFADEVPGFLAFWKETPYELLGFINSNSIKKIRVIPKEDTYGAL